MSASSYRAEKWSPQDKPRRWPVKKFDRDVFAECISRTLGLDKTRTTDGMIRHYTTEIRRACDASMARRRQYKNQRPAFWWNTEISELWTSYIKQRRKAQGTRNRRRPEKQQEEDRYKDVRKLLWNAIKQSKRQCWKVMCFDVDRDSWGTPYRLVTWKLQARQESGAPADLSTVLKIVEALFPKRAPF